MENSIIFMFLLTVPLYHLLVGKFIPGVKTGLNNVWTVFTLWLETCLHHGWGHVYNIFARHLKKITLYSKHVFTKFTCLKNIQKKNYTMFETGLQNIERLSPKIAEFS